MKGYTTGSYYQRLEDQPAKYDETRSQRVVKEFFLNSSRACKAKCWKRGVQALVREVFRSVVFRLLEWACGWELWVLFWLWADVLVLYCVTYFPISIERFTCTSAYQTHKVLCIYVRGDTDTIGNTLTEIQNRKKKVLYQYRLTIWVCIIVCTYLQIFRRNMNRQIWISEFNGIYIRMNKNKLLYRIH